MSHAPPTGHWSGPITLLSSELSSPRPACHIRTLAGSICSHSRAQSPQQHSILSLCLKDKAYQAKRTSSDKNTERLQKQLQLGGEHGSGAGSPKPRLLVRTYKGHRDTGFLTKLPNGLGLWTANTFQYQFNIFNLCLFSNIIKKKNSSPKKKKSNSAYILEKGPLQREKG